MNQKKKATLIVTIVGVILASLASWFFTLIGAGVSMGPDRLTTSVVKWPMPIWHVWGILWGAFCGYIISCFLIKTLLEKRNAPFGLLYGFVGGFTIGLVNGILTGTTIFGVIIGLVLGPIPGLILAGIFLGVYKPK